jgi:hypothetical protein
MDHLTIARIRPYKLGGTVGPLSIRELWITRPCFRFDHAKTGIVRRAIRFLNISR